jgi:glycosyltransferase involved in cell wall biosynthesis
LIEVNPVGRNEPCPCGSGKRYKDCHGSLRGVTEQVVAPASVKPEAIDLRDAARKFDAGDLDGAETLLRNALANHPRDAEALHLLGRCEHKRGRAWEALRLALDAARAIPEAPVPSATQFAIWTDLNAMFVQALWGVDAAFAAAKRAEYARWVASRSDLLRDATPLVSIVVIADGSEGDLHTALTSIGSQSYRELEVVVVAPEAVPTRIGNLLAAFPFPSSVVSHPPAHRAVLLNAGVQASRGEFVNPLLPGDEFASSRIGAMVEQIANRNWAWGFGDVEFVEPDDAPWDKRTRTRVERWREILERVPNLDTVGFALIQEDCAAVAAGNLFFRRALADRLSGFRALDHTYVWDFCLRAVWLEEPWYVASRLLRHGLVPALLPKRIEFEAAEVPVFGEYYHRACDEHAVAPNPYAPCLHHWRSHFLKAPFNAGHLLVLGLDRVEEIAAELVRRNEAQRSRTLAPGIDLVGFAFGEFGLGESLRAFAHACADAKIPFSVKDVDQRLKTRQTDLSIGPYIADELRHRCALFCVNPDMMYCVQPLIEASSATGAYKIGYWYWELERIPAAWNDHLAHLDEMWVATEFVAAAMRAATSMPVIKITPPIAVRLSRPYRRSDFALQENRFLFLFSFDFLSFPKRKNPEGAVTAFRKAFGDRSDVGLVLKSINGNHHPERLAQIEELAGRDERIVMLDRFVSRDEISGLQSVVDCFVSLHRSEGLGLGLAESMYQGKPVIGTRYSGNLEFMNDDNSCLVDCELVPVRKGEYLYDDERFRWAEPDLDQAAHYMRRLVDDAAFRERIARNGQDSIRSRFNGAAAAASIRRRLEELGFL